MAFSLFGSDHPNKRRLHGGGTAVTPNQQRAVRIDVLGPLRVVVDGVEVPVPGERRRAVLALLALAAGDVCSVDEVLGEVWPDELPGTGRRALHSHVSRLRRHLGAHRARLASVGAGYRLELLDDELDAAVAQRLAAEARAVRDTDPHAAVALLAEALKMWRGTALEEFPDVAGLATEAVALAALRADLRDEWLEARLATGDRTVQGDAARAAAEDPLRERTAMVLIRALAQADRPADAMRVAHDYRERLADATGFSTSATFAELESAVAT
jgi:DNA-binding SARP family transcriptional activator